MERHSFGFIGLGVIGGSLAKALRSLDPSASICAYTRSRETSEKALSEGVIDVICSGPSDPAFAACDVIFLCAPVENNIAALEPLAKAAGSRPIITDVGSVKTGIHEEARRLGLSARFIGGHPMTGSERSGLDSSTEHLFENAYYILTPEPETDPEVLERLTGLARSLGAIPLRLDYRQHDFITAAVSHLPHLVAAALVNTVHNLDTREEYMKLIAAGGFKDITRIASSSPEMWEQICITNEENIAEVMDEFLRLLEEAKDHMTKGDGRYIRSMFRDSRDYRNSFTDKPLGPIKKTWRIYCDIVDESGAIATIATTLAVNGISIKNIGIVNNREFEGGVLRIEFYEEEPSRKAAELLRQHRYNVIEAH